MKRKVLLAILGTFVLFMLVSVGVFYFYLLRPAQQVLGDLDQVAELQGMNDLVRDKSPFTPPSNGELTPEDLARFARVQETMTASLGEADLALLLERAARLKGLVLRGEEMETRAPNMRQALLAFEGLGPALTRAKEAQIQGLNREGFSAEEYRWVRERVYAGLGFSRPNAYLEDVAARLQRGDKEPEGEAPAEPAPVPERNREVTAPYAPFSDDWFPFLVFGL
jgi:hypothetical protein